MWRYAEVLPERTGLAGEGFTPMLPSRESPNVYIKDEGLKPTGSFKARGLSPLSLWPSITSERNLPSFAGKRSGGSGGYAAAAGNRGVHLHAQRRPHGEPHRIEYYVHT